MCGLRIHLLRDRIYGDADGHPHVHQDLLELLGILDVGNDPQLNPVALTVRYFDLKELIRASKLRWPIAAGREGPQGVVTRRWKVVPRRSLSINRA
jgi:hypothetical protein